jgi:hypothetical protein
MSFMRPLTENTTAWVANDCGICTGPHRNGGGVRQSEKITFTIFTIVV